MVGSKSIGQFVLMGVSAGAFGTAFNCDKVIITDIIMDFIKVNIGTILGFVKVADMVKAKDANADMRCLFDGLDFIPTEVGKGLIIFTYFQIFRHCII